MGWGLSADPRGCGLGQVPTGFFCRGKGQTGILGGVGKRDRVSPGPPHLFWDPSGPSRLGPQQSSLFSRGPLSEESRRRQGESRLALAFLAL